MTPKRPSDINPALARLGEEFDAEDAETERAIAAREDFDPAKIVPTQGFASVGTSASSVHMNGSSRKETAPTPAPYDASTFDARSWIDAASTWYENHRNDKGGVPTNVITAGLIVSGMVRDGLPIPDDRIQSEKGSQVRGLSGSAVREILAKYGETRRFTSEGGRTSRGTLGIAKSLRDVLSSHSDRHNVEPEELGDLAGALDMYFVGRIQADYFDKQKLDVELDPSKPVAHAVSAILRAAAERADNPAGAVLQHLVGAKLELRFPDAEIGRDQANAADLQTARQGDFEIGTTAFHVTMSPMEKLIDRCKQNRNHGFRPVIVVPSNRVEAAVQNAEMGGIADGVNVIAAETFIGTNIEEIAGYEGPAIKSGLAQLIERYNERIEAVEPDQSLRIDVPKWAASVLDASGN